MFAVTTKQEQGFDKVILSDDATHTEAEIVPRWGAMLHAFCTRHHGHTINVIDSYESGEDIAQYLTAKGFKSSKLSPFVCRVKNATYNFEGETYTINKFLLGESAIHGLLYDAAFEIISTTADEDKATVSLLHHYQGTDAGYPFAYDCTVTYTLEKNSRLSVETRIVNKSKSLIPVQDGWHPYFSFGKKIDELQLEFQSRELIEFNAALVPTGRLIPYREFNALKNIGTTEYDNCFTLDFAECQPLCVVRDPAQKIQVEIHPEKTYPYLQLYTPPHRTSIAIENLSGAPDGFNNAMGVITLNSGEETAFKTAYKLKVLDM